MRTKIINSLVLCSIILMCNNSFGQGPGSFMFSNNTGCDVDVTIYSYDGDCNGVVCGDNVDVYGAITVSANTTSNVASGFSGSGDVWGKVEVVKGGNTTMAGAGDCGSNGDINCLGDNPAVQWDGCTSAHIP